MNRRGAKPRVLSYSAISSIRGGGSSRDKRGRERAARVLPTAVPVGNPQENIAIFYRTMVRESWLILIWATFFFGTIAVGNASPQSASLLSYREMGKVKMVDIGGTSPAWRANAVSMSANDCFETRSALSI
jgi:hypothetical protein